MSVKTAIIGGTGVYDPRILSGVREEKITTPYGTVKAVVGSYRGREIAFMARHGADHSVPPHLVNYRGNIAALRELGVKNIFATAAVGSLNPEMKPGQFVFVDQFLDFTKGRPSTFVEEGVVHLDMTDPYCPGLRSLLAGSAEKLGLEFHRGGVYVCAEGPRFETAAEIKMFRLLGGDLVGMTSVPEVVLAREAGICYATIAMVTNFAAGISPNKLSHQEVVEMMAENAERLKGLIMQAVSDLDEDRSCACQMVESPVNPVVSNKQ
ncbi:MAG: S-methyl-5'-thioadenosine phosphorylase [Peptococcaceae bacterium]|nr:S-methyl-5'-thioadenosine phosphorylase [Peptococcaceae bacterium]